MNPTESPAYTLAPLQPLGVNLDGLRHLIGAPPSTVTIWRLENAA
jgi:hypothetical protein